MKAVDQVSEPVLPRWMVERSIDECIATLPQRTQWFANVMARLRACGALPEHPRALDVGANTGLLVLAARRTGLECEGVEPVDEAREAARQIGVRLGVPLEVAAGRAESLPFPEASFDIVLANSVMEHVESVERAFAEAFRVLRPGGVFWFSTASSMCPIQHEIQRFPLFGWYPEQVKVRVMHWAKDHRPELVGHSWCPAIHWFTPWKARRLLQDAGFGRVVDRWDLRRPEEGGRLYRVALEIIRPHPMLHLAADVLVSACAYAAFKPV